MSSVGSALDASGITLTPKSKVSSIEILQPPSPPLSTCVDPDHRELIRSVGTVIHRRVRDNETADYKHILPLFCEDTHTAPVLDERFEVTVPLLHLQMLSFPTLFTLSKLPVPEAPHRDYVVPDARMVATFIENIRQKARLTPQALVITLIYIDRLEARSEGVLLHSRSWRPLVFASLLLASKVWHDISYWNSDFQSICPMFHVRNINKMERAILQLLQYNTIVSASQYAQYYFSLRHAVRTPGPRAGDDTSEAAENESSGRITGFNGVGDGGDASSSRTNPSGNFRSKYFMAIAVAGSSRLQEQSAAVANQQGASSQLDVPPHHALDDALGYEDLPPDELVTSAASAALTATAGTAGSSSHGHAPTAQPPPPQPVPIRKKAFADDDDDWGTQLFSNGGMASSL